MDFVSYLDWLVTNADAVTGRRKAPRRAPPRHPGAVLHEGYLVPRQLTQTALAHMTGSTPAKINEIVNGKRGITPAFAVVLERELGAPAAMWLSLQLEFDLWRVRQTLKGSVRRSPSAD